MSLFQIIETLFIGPLKLLFEFIFEISGRFVSHPGLMIVFLSLTMNILVLPLYRRADAMQEAARDTEAKLHDGVAHIKKVFSGDEKMMMLQTYYRQNNYKPTDALHGSVSLLLEIPFFMAAYQFLSHLKTLEGVSLGPIADLSRPDGLLVIGGIAINILPFIMTLVNLISSSLYLKGFPLKTKIQLYGMAAFFLIFLYASPSGLVFYWTLNNLFSLVKTIFYKLKNPGKVIRYLTAIVGATVAAFGAFFYNSPTLKQRAFLVGIGLALLLPIVLHIAKSKIHIKRKNAEVVPKKSVFVCGCVFLTVIIGILIPSALIASSPQEFVDILYFNNPLWYIAASALTAAGTFLIWLRVFYWLASPSYKVIFERFVWILCGVTLVNYMFFGTNLGVLSSSLKYENGLYFSLKQQLFNILVLCAVAAVMFFIIKKWRNAVVPIILTAVIAFGAMSTVSIISINSSLDKIVSEGSDETPEFRLSTSGKNVVVLMLDRALAEVVPYVFNEKPELKDKYAGFTFYNNVISYGGSTNFGTPPMFGGYEYTPVEMNKRDTEKLVSKHNESLKVLPVLFLNNGFEVTLCDPVYANYQWTPDLSIFDDYPEIKTYITKGKYSSPEMYEQSVSNNMRNFFCYSLMKTMPLSLQTTIYAKGTYNQTQAPEGNAYTEQTTDGLSKAVGTSKAFMDSYNVLANFSKITKITDDETNTYAFISNDMTHEPILLQTPDYVPSNSVDNTEYDQKHADRFTVDGKTLNITTENQIKHYHANMAALSLVGDWLDYLRKNNVYDNTKIIIVSDHGTSLASSDELTINNAGVDFYAERYYPLMLVKDFNSKEFTVSDEFMTNADVPVLATDGVIENPVNPFTEKELNSDEKTAHEQYITLSYSWSTAENNGNTFVASNWVSVKDNIWDKNNWKFYNSDIVMKENKFPNE